MAVSLIVLKYIVALDVHRNFVKAAEACGVTQPTLSTVVRNFENELDVVIFDRSAHPIVPTVLGEKIITMARTTLRSADQIEEFVAQARGEDRGELSLGIIPTVSPYILPEFFRTMQQEHPGICLRVAEMRTELVVEKLLRAELDAAIMATPLEHKGLLEIPLYYEKFVAYVSPSDELYAMPEVPVSMLATDRLWVLEEGHCLRNQVMNFCHVRSRAQQRYQAGSISTLVDIVDLNGGYTVIPQLHVGLLSEDRKKCLREIIGDRQADNQDKMSEDHLEMVSEDNTVDKNCLKCIPNREISLVIREDFIRERMLNIVADTIKTIIPDEMLDARLKKYSIKI